MAFQVQRAGSTGLLVKCGCNLGQRFEAKWQWLKAHRTAIKALDVEVGGTQDGTLERLVSTISFPNLHTFIVTAVYKRSNREQYLDELPSNFGDADHLRHLRFIYMSIPILSIAHYPHLRSLHLQSSDIPLYELQQVLRKLTSLDELVIGGKLITSALDAQAQTPLSSLTYLAFTGQLPQFEVFLEAFDVSSVRKWSLALKGTYEALISLHRFRSLLRTHISSVYKTELRWLSRRHSKIRLHNSVEDGSFELNLDIHGDGAAPFKCVAGMLGGDGLTTEMKSCMEVGLICTGMKGIGLLTQTEDEDVRQVLHLWRSVKEIKMSGNGELWGRIPVVVQAALRTGETLLPKLARVKFIKTDIESHVLEDWVMYAIEVGSERRKFDLWRVQRSMVSELSRENLNLLTSVLPYVCKVIDGGFETEVSDQ